MDDARALAQTHDLRDGGILRAREDVDGGAHARELPRQLTHVDVHAARLLAAKRGERARVDAEHGDAKKRHAGPPNGAFRGEIVTRTTSSSRGSKSSL